MCGIFKLSGRVRRIFLREERLENDEAIHGKVFQKKWLRPPCHSCITPGGRRPESVGRVFKYEPDIPKNVF